MCVCVCVCVLDVSVSVSVSVSVCERECVCECAPRRSWCPIANATLAARCAETDWSSAATCFGVQGLQEYLAHEKTPTP